MTRVGKVAVGALSLAAIGLLSVACDSGRPAVGDGASGSPPTGAGGGDQFVTDGGTVAPPGCGTLSDGSQCDCIDVPLFVDPPTIYFVLDRSGSMAIDDKWNRVRVTVGKIMRSLGPRASFGAAVFPGTTSEDVCTPGVEIMSARPGDPPSSGVDGPTTLTLLAATRMVPNGGTPTGASLDVVRTKIGSISGKVFVILATDGAPNCNENAGCGYDECQLNIESVPGCAKEGPFNCCEPPDGYRENCNDSTATLGSIQALRSTGTPVYVVGLPGAAAYSSLLDRMAVTGGTALPTSPRYFAVDTASENVMLTTLKKIAAQITGTCTFELREAPSAPERVNVYMDDVILPYEPVDGWTLGGKTVTLVGNACDRVKNGDVLGVRIIAGCPRVEPR